jgi:ribosomal peptide maturation radical SAM protein 1
MDAMLVCMPYAVVKIPSLALGILQAILDREGLTSESVYANLMFAEQIGLTDYDGLVGRARPQEALADWTFAHLAFPDFESDFDSYRELLRSRSFVHRLYAPEVFTERIFAVRREATRFINRLAAHILSKSPSMVGCSSTFCQHVPSLALLRRIRDVAPDIVTVLGGANCETVMGRTTHASFPWVDYVVSGEADNLIGPLVRGIVKYGRDIEVDDLPEGVFAPVHRSVGYPGSGSSDPDELPRATVQSLANQPIPDYDDYFAELNKSPALRQAVTPGLSVETSRGCWWGHGKGCTFCGLNGRGKSFRAKSAKHAFREFYKLRDRYGISRFEAVDNIMDMRYLNTLIPKLKAAGSPFSLFYETKSNLSKKHLQQMRNAGIIWIQPGIESLHTKVLSLMNKGCKAWHNIQLLKWCRQFGMRCIWVLLHDFPGDKDSWYQEMAAMIPLLAHLQPPNSVVPIRYDRYSHYHENAEKYQLDFVPAKPYSYVYPLAKKDLTDLVYFFDERGRENLRTSEVLQMLLIRKGIEDLRRHHISWLGCFSSDEPPVLSMNVSKEAVVVRDTRPIAVNARHVLEDVERDLYLACEDAPKSETVLNSLMETGLSQTKIEAARARLLENKLLLEIDGRYLTLAVREPVVEYAAPEDFPGGYVDLERSPDPSAEAAG